MRNEVGLAFGLLQGLMGVVGTLLGGRWFDRAVRSGTGRVLGPPAILLVIASAITSAALFEGAGGGAEGPVRAQGMSAARRGSAAARPLAASRKRCVA